MKTLNESLLEILQEWKHDGSSKCDVSTIPLGDPRKDGWVIYVKNVPVDAVLEAARDLAEKSPSWPKNTLIKSAGPLPLLNREAKV
jgi:hypothetical protein